VFDLSEWGNFRCTTCYWSLSNEEDVMARPMGNASTVLEKSENKYFTLEA
jgi:hypothetical protein